MAHAQTATLEHDKLQLGGVGTRIALPAVVVGVAALLIAGWKGFSTANDDLVTHVFHSYLAAYAFFMALTLGSLAFVLIQHLARAGWSVTVRRVAEGLSLNMFLMVVLLLPFFITVNGRNGINRLFTWYQLEKVASDEVLHSKSNYLNPEFFAIRIGICFVFWCGVAWFYAGKSAEQDRTGNPKISTMLDKLGAPAIVLFGFTLTAFAFDWIMSLNPYWFSTIFGVYFFAGAMLSAFSAIVLLSLALQKRGLATHAITHEHYHDLGKWMFAFTFFWGYIMFGQFMLIWYANMPEETQFYIPRQFEPWAGISLMLLVVHLLIPFPGLISRHVKRKNGVLAFWAVWSLCACALDVYWLVVPNQWINRIPAEAGDPAMPISNALALVADRHDIYHIQGHPHLVELSQLPLQPVSLAITALCFVGIGGLYIFSTMMALRGKSLVPTRDPRLNEALGFENI